ncbi:iron ABC transporter permease [Caulobacter segnis]|uniref:FecCD family ABC transporter permease n=1 Tax=Caulobacter segnis TaxID=88688 RepID=UPI00240F9616|nr:iron ABC transporter permease [Caulobacter segnis]MDG2521845.1 iron ABC transporter permease [Caulobacter segnis]
MTLKQPLGQLYAGLGIAVAVLFVASLFAGKVWVPWSAFTDRADPRWPIIFDLRLPRAILGVAVGAALGASGAAMQGYTRNPLASPDVLGVSSMASLFAVLTLYFNLAEASAWVLPTAAMLGAMTGVVLLLVLAGATSSIVTFILAGAILQIITAAGVSLALSLAPNPWAVQEIVSWIHGALADRSIDEVRFALPFILTGLVLLMTQTRTFDALTLGDIGARSLGIDVNRSRLFLVVGVGLAVGASTAVTGMIGFVGLVTPHLLRPFVASRPGALILPSAIGGAAIVLAADILVRVIPTATEVKLNVAMAAIGGPFFLALLIRLRRRIA